MAIVNCGGDKCNSDFQDKTYGKNKRVANKTAATTATYRCTVCLKLHQQIVRK